MYQHLCAIASCSHHYEVIDVRKPHLTIATNGMVIPFDLPPHKVIFIVCVQVMAVTDSWHVDSDSERKTVRLYFYVECQLSAAGCLLPGNKLVCEKCCLLRSRD